MTPEQLKELRHMLGMTQRKLADALGIFQQTVARWESGKRAVPADFGFVLGLHAPLPSLSYLIDHPEAFTSEMEMARCVAEIRFFRDRIAEAEKAQAAVGDTNIEASLLQYRRWQDQINDHEGRIAHAAIRLVDLMTEQALATHAARSLSQPQVSRA